MLLWKDTKIAVMKIGSGFSEGLLDSRVQKICISHKANTSSVNQHLGNLVLEHFVCVGVKAPGLNVSTKGTRWAVMWHIAEQ